VALIEGTKPDGIYPELFVEKVNEFHYVKLGNAQILNDVFLSKLTLMKRTVNNARMH